MTRSRKKKRDIPDESIQQKIGRDIGHRGRVDAVARDCKLTARLPFGAQVRLNSRLGKQLINDHPDLSGHLFSPGLSSPSSLSKRRFRWPRNLSSIWRGSFPSSCWSLSCSAPPLRFPAAVWVRSRRDSPVHRTATRDRR